MFFILSKTAAFLLLPSNFLITLILIGLVLMVTRFKRVGRWLAGAAFILLMASGFLPIGKLLIHALENRFPRWDTSHGPPDGIVVLGGAFAPYPLRAPDEPSLSSEGTRIIAIGKLARAYPNARIVFTSGDASLRANSLAEADYLAPLLDSMGVPRERILLESRSRNTFENAVLSKELMAPKPGERWLLVTSAWHMPRAVGCFRQIGFPVEAYPVGWRTDKRISLKPSTEFGSGLAATDFAVHEWIGLMAYWLTGRTGQLLPGPAQN
jgi:uncharacterized SAM-binding protein YcdF (DUF218 family)